LRKIKIADNETNYLALEEAEHHEDIIHIPPPWGGIIHINIHFILSV
jgi:hypothetical protein